MPGLLDREKLGALQMRAKRAGVLRRGVVVELAVEEFQAALDVAELVQIVLWTDSQNLVDVKGHLVLLIARQRGEVAVVIELHDARQMLANGIVEQLRGLQIFARGDVVACGGHVRGHRCVEPRRERRNHRAPHAGARPRKRQQRRHPAPRHR
ncbi:hypothetical protein ADM96_33325 [Burkholderia sp. ST111]|nr:hypothetical protein ADM96_33325 [Burkholderia sp. ST111]